MPNLFTYKKLRRRFVILTLIILYLAIACWALHRESRYDWENIQTQSEIESEYQMKSENEHESVSMEFD